MFDLIHPDAFAEQMGLELADVLQAAYRADLRPVDRLDGKARFIRGKLLQACIRAGHAPEIRGIPPAPFFKRT